jgi:hypothetical protein
MKPGTLVMLTRMGERHPGWPEPGATGLVVGEHERPNRVVVDFFRHRINPATGQPCRFIVCRAALMRLTPETGKFKAEA